jgi:hypothetical protein
MDIAIKREGGQTEETTDAGKDGCPEDVLILG